MRRLKDETNSYDYYVCNTVIDMFTVTNIIAVIPIVLDILILVLPLFLLLLLVVLPRLLLLFLPLLLFQAFEKRPGRVLADFCILHP